MSLQRTCALNAISNESALIYFAFGKFCLHDLDFVYIRTGLKFSTEI